MSIYSTNDLVMSSIIAITFFVVCCHTNPTHIISPKHHQFITPWLLKSKHIKHWMGMFIVLLRNVPFVVEPIKKETTSPLYGCLGFTWFVFFFSFALFFALYSTICAWCMSCAVPTVITIYSFNVWHFATRVANIKYRFSCKMVSIMWFGFSFW